MKEKLGVVLWTRALEDWEEDCNLWAGADIPVLHCPCVERVPLPTPSAWQQLLPAEQQNKLILWTSQAAIRQTATEASSELLRVLQTYRHLGVGKKTVQQLANTFGAACVDLDATVGSAAAAYQYLCQHYLDSEAVVEVLLPGARVRAFAMEQSLARTYPHIKSCRFDLYETRLGIPETYQKALTWACQRNFVDAVFASPSAVKGLAQSVCVHAEKELIKWVRKAYAIGQSTAQACAHYLPNTEVYVAQEPSVEALWLLVQQHF
ncbi:MAG: uroporphyrinogen-III synthase [Zetaproteobacteria bacterium]|nr:uroporphyrinogen-III synthase [Zetaproteobacteria bacterium]